MLDGPSVTAVLEDLGFTHVVWVPDSVIGTWEAALLASPRLELIRVCREGEALAVAGGLYLGGCRPMVLLQCTGLFEAGDSLRNLLYDLHLPLFLVIGVRSYLAHRQGASKDSCPRFIEPFVQAWQLPCVLLDDSHTAADLGNAIRQARAEGRAGAVLVAE